LEFTGPTVVRLRASGPCAGRRQVAIALCAVVDGHAGINVVVGCDRFNRSGLGGFVAVGDVRTA
jgi:hypothetical protein